MARKFKQVDYDQVVQISLRVGDCIPAGHLARFIVGVIALMDLSAIYARYGLRGVPPFDRGEPLPSGWVIEEELVHRQERLLGLAEAKAVILARAEQRYTSEQAAYEAKLQEREDKAHASGRNRRVGSGLLGFQSQAPAYAHQRPITAPIDFSDRLLVVVRCPPAP